MRIANVVFRSWYPSLHPAKKNILAIISTGKLFIPFLSTSFTRCECKSATRRGNKSQIFAVLLSSSRRGSQIRMSWLVKGAESDCKALSLRTSECSQNHGSKDRSNFTYHSPRHLNIVSFHCWIVFNEPIMLCDSIKSLSDMSETVLIAEIVRSGGDSFIWSLAVILPTVVADRSATSIDLF